MSALSVGAGGAQAQSGCDLDLQGVDLGTPGAAGSESCAGGVYTITGAGTGHYDRFRNASTGDSGHLSYVTATGDIEIVARVASFTGEPEAQVGLLIRESASSSALMGSVVVRQPASSGENAYFFNSDRRVSLHPNEVGQGCSPSWNGSRPPISPPYWIKLIRLGKNFATSRSSDGVRWSPIANYSGGVFDVSGPFLAGLFISSGQSGVTATATVDSLYIGAPRLEYRTSFVGNSHASDSEGWISTICAIWVGPDGRCYTNTAYDEGSQGTKIFSPEGRIIGSCMEDPCFGGGGVCDGSITGDASSIYMAFHRDNEDLVLRADHDGQNHSNSFTFASPILKIGGLAAGNGELYVSDVPRDRIVVASTATMAETRSFPFTRPGPMAVDSRGDLWIIQRAADWPVAYDFTHPYVGSVRCFHPDGTFTGREITDVVSPTAVCVDPNLDRLLVCENGIDQNIRIYSDIDTAPLHTSSFGTAGGIFGSGVPGLLNDPDHGGSQRLFIPSSVGVDGSGNLYVSCNPSGSTLRKYDPDGNLLWSVSGVPFQECPDFDPTTDGQDLYMGKAHFRMDYSSTAPGSEWTFTGMLWNPFGTDTFNDRANASVFRRFGPNNDPFLFVLQGYGGLTRIFRFQGELAIPCGKFFGPTAAADQLWIDENGDGIETPDEYSPVPLELYGQGGGKIWTDVDGKGDLYVLHHFGYDYAAGIGFIRHVTMQGINAQGVPTYRLEPGSYTDTTLPTEILYIQGFRYDEPSDSMYLLGYDDYLTHEVLKLGRWEHWSTTRDLRFLTRLPTPMTEPNFIHSAPYPSPEGFDYFAMDAVGGMVFLGELWGPIHVFDANLGNEVIRLFPGAEVSGVEAFNDLRVGGVRAMRRSNGEYVVVRENSGYRACDLLFRWTPGVASPPEAPRNLMAEGASDRIRLRWTGGFGLTRSYSLWRGEASGAETLLAQDLTAPVYDDTTAERGVRYHYFVTAVNEIGTSDPSHEVVESVHTSAQFIREDTQTIGNWLGAYGSKGYTIVGGGRSFPPEVELKMTGHFPPREPYSGTPREFPLNSDPRALVKPDGTGRVTGSWSEVPDPPRMIVDIDLTEHGTAVVAMYFVFFENTETTYIDAYDGLGAFLGRRTVDHFQSGKYEVWRISGHVRFEFTPTDGTRIGLSGIFLGCGTAFPDADSDGIEDCADTCPLTPNPDQGPIIACVADRTVVANRPCGYQQAGLLPRPTVASDCGGSGAVDFTSDAPALFPVGTTVVTWTATDTAGRTTTCTQRVTVVDKTPLSIQCPDPISVECTSPDGALVDFEPSATDACGGVTIESTPPSGSRFSPGTTRVLVTARDAAGNTAACSFDVTVTCAPGGGSQKPGDCNQDGDLDISDGICLLGHLFLGSPSKLPCTGGTIQDPGNIALFDANGDGQVDLSDAVTELQFLFAGGTPPVLGTECAPIVGCPEKCASAER